MLVDQQPVQAEVAHHFSKCLEIHRLDHIAIGSKLISQFDVRVFGGGYSAKVSAGSIQINKLPAKQSENGHYVIRPKRPSWLVHVDVSSRVLVASCGDAQRC